MEQLEQNAISPERKRELDAWLDFLEDAKVQKMGKVKAKPVVYFT